MKVVVAVVILVVAVVILIVVSLVAIFIIHGHKSASAPIPAPTVTQTTPVNVPAPVATPAAPPKPANFDVNSSFSDFAAGFQAQLKQTEEDNQISNFSFRIQKNYSPDLPMAGVISWERRDNQAPDVFSDYQLIFTPDKTDAGYSWSVYGGERTYGSDGVGVIGTSTIDATQLARFESEAQKAISQ